MELKLNCTANAVAPLHVYTHDAHNRLDLFLNVISVKYCSTYELGWTTVTIGCSKKAGDFIHLDFAGTAFLITFSGLKNDQMAQVQVPDWIVQLRTFPEPFMRTSDVHLVTEAGDLTISMGADSDRRRWIHVELCDSSHVLVRDPHFELDAAAAPQDTALRPLH